MSQAPLLSLIIATRGRAMPFQALFESLEAQSFKDFEVIVVDQNVDERVGAPAAEGWSFPILHLRTPHESGASRARNTGATRAGGSVLLFPDDDCWYPHHMLAHAVALMGTLGVDIFAGRAANEAGRDINGRFEAAAAPIDRATVWTTGIEWVVFFKRAVFESLGGYDSDVGIGAATPWQSCEAQDIMLRALKRGYSCHYDPSVYGHHAELDITHPSMRRKGRAYARGLGYVLRHHHYPVTTAAKWVLRPAIRATLAMLRGDSVRFGYYRNVVLGRLEGWRMRVPSSESRWPSAPTTLGLSKN